MGTNAEPNFLINTKISIKFNELFLGDEYVKVNYKQNYGNLRYI